MLDLRDPELELRELAAGDEPEKRPASPCPVRSLSRTVSLRHRPISSSISERASSYPSPPRAATSSASASARSAVSATAPTPARTSFSASSLVELAGSAMRSCPSPLAAPLPLGR